MEEKADKNFSFPSYLISDTYEIKNVSAMIF